MLEALVNQVRDEDVLFGTFFLARTIEGELVLAVNNRIDREEDFDTGQTRRKFWTRIYYSNKPYQDVLSFEQMGKERKEYKTGLIVPVEDSLYHELYDLWAESASTEEERDLRKSLVVLHWIATNLPPSEGE